MGDLTVTADPTTLSFPAGGGEQTFQLANGGGEKAAIKIKCSNNACYRVNPVFSMLEPGAPSTITVKRIAGEPKEDRLVVQYLAAGAAGTSQEAYQAGGSPGELTISLSAKAEEAAAPAADAGGAPAEDPGAAAPPAE